MIWYLLCCIQIVGATAIIKEKLVEFELGSSEQKGSTLTTWPLPRPVLAHLYAQTLDQFVGGCRHSLVDSTAPSIVLPRFESKEHHLCFHQFIELYNVEKTKINNKRPGLAHFLKKNISSKCWHRSLFGDR